MRDDTCFYDSTRCLVCAGRGEKTWNENVRVETNGKARDDHVTLGV
jgi:hypothetical protein